MKKTIKIKNLIERYKAFIRYKEMAKKELPESIEYYRFIEMDALREIAKLKAESPTSFKFACAINRLILN